LDQIGRETKSLERLLKLPYVIHSRRFPKESLKDAYELALEFTSHGEIRKGIGLFQQVWEAKSEFKTESSEYTLVLNAGAALEVYACFNQDSELEMDVSSIEEELNKHQDRLSPPAQVIHSRTKKGQTVDDVEFDFGDGEMTKTSEQEIHGFKRLCETNLW